MKDIIKIESLRMKVPVTFRPKAHEVAKLMGKHEHNVPPSRIDKFIEVLEREHKNNVAFLEARKQKFIPKS